MSGPPASVADQHQRAALRAPLVSLQAHHSVQHQLFVVRGFILFHETTPLFLGNHQAITQRGDQAILAHSGAGRRVASRPGRLMRPGFHDCSGYPAPTTRAGTKRSSRTSSTCSDGP
jgi:hypothetical protein